MTSQGRARQVMEAFRANEPEDHRKIVEEAIEAAVAEERQRCAALAAAALGDDYGLAAAILAEVK